MKKFLRLASAALFLLTACETGGYPPFEYINNSPYDISFKTAEKDSPEYQLKRKAGTTVYSMTLDSDVRGRAEIDGDSLKPVYTDWRQAEGDIYRIEFFERDAITVKIRNTTGDKITLSEKRGYLKPEKKELASGAAEIDAVIYTKTPSFEISGNTYPAKTDFHMAADKSVMYVLISLR
jgi:hypothetical protein